MRVLTDVNDLPKFKNGVLTIGTFDGVHVGHQQIIQRINALAREMDGESIILTFHPHPRLVINPNDQELKLLNTLDEKIELLETYGVDNLIIAPFSIAFSQIPAKAYVQDFLWQNIRPKAIVIGYDHRFGNKREGNIELIASMGNDLGFTVQEIEKQMVDEISISSTKIRTALLDGKVHQANQLLGHLFTLQGEVVKGKQLGRQLGFPTANIDVGDMHKLIPPNGIYAVKVQVGENQYGGAMSIGTNPTFNGTNRTLEVYIINFNEDIYGQQIKVSFVEYLRAEAKFESLEALKEQMYRDVDSSKIILNL